MSQKTNLIFSFLLRKEVAASSPILKEFCRVRKRNKVIWFLKEILYQNSKRISFTILLRKKKEKKKENSGALPCLFSPSYFHLHIFTQLASSFDRHVKGEKKSPILEREMWISGPEERQQRQRIQNAGAWVWRLKTQATLKWYKLLYSMKLLTYRKRNK